MKLMTNKKKILSERIKGLIVSTVDSVNTIVLTTLDGGVHVQAIGNHHPIVTFQCLVDQSAVEVITESFINGGVLTLSGENLSTRFIQIEAPGIERFSNKFKNGLYIVNIRGKTQ